MNQGTILAGIIVIAALLVVIRLRSYLRERKRMKQIDRENESWDNFRSTVYQAHKKAEAKKKTDVYTGSSSFKAKDLTPAAKREFTHRQPRSLRDADKEDYPVQRPRYTATYPESPLLDPLNPLSPISPLNPFGVFQQAPESYDGPRYEGNGDEYNQTHDSPPANDWSPPTPDNSPSYEAPSYDPPSSSDSTSYDSGDSSSYDSGSSSFD